MNAKKATSSSRPESMADGAELAAASVKALFMEPSVDGPAWPDIEERTFLDYLWRTLNAIHRELSGRCPAGALAAESAAEPVVDSLDLVNALVKLAGRRTFASVIEAAALDVIAGGDAFDGVAEVVEPRRRYLLAHADRLCREAPGLIRDYVAMVEGGKPGTGVSRVNPALLELGEPSRLFQRRRGETAATHAARIEAAVAANDPFPAGGVFRLLGGGLVPARLENIRPPEKFYGFREARSLFKDHFREFASGMAKPPLLISSLPGLGKTHFTISHCLANGELTLVIANPEDLESPLERLLGTLGRRRKHRFVLFFDDVDPKTVNWYYFRTHVGGSFSPPDNVAMVISSNYRFPANILSRGRGFTFPFFDEIRCMEMVCDYLATYHMRSPNKDLVAVIAADYVEEFGQKKFEELSPRTLVRYLERYDRDVQKRKSTLEVSRGELVPQPDAQCFFEVNVKIMQALYGEAAVDELRKERLSN